nr:hypothetical protein IMFVHALQ_IMFVHALQ_CDS_0006 [Microvirus sp.]
MSAYKIKECRRSHHLSEPFCRKNNLIQTFSRR